MKKSSRFMQYVAAIAVALIAISHGTTSTWPSPTLPLLFLPNSPIGVTLTEEEGSWIASLPMLVSVFAAVLSGWIFDRFGRKYCLLTSAVPLAACWIITIFARSFGVLCVARFLAGIGSGLVKIGCPMYISEIVDKDIRGGVGVVERLMIYVGHLLIYGAGPFISYKFLATLCLILPVLFMAAFVFMPESPYHLLRVGRSAEARKVVARIYSTGEDDELVSGKMKEIEMAVETKGEEKSFVAELFDGSEHRKALLIMFGLRTLEQLSGINALEPYLQTIIQSAETKLSPEVSSIIFGSIQLPTVLIAALLVDRVGRKPLLIISAFGSSLGMFAVGVYFYMKNFPGAGFEEISWLPLTALVFYLFMNSLGVGTLSDVILGEIFSPNIKGSAMALASFYFGCTTFLIRKFFPALTNALGIENVFFAFAASCLLGTVYVFFCVPETKGEPFSEIQRKLRGELRLKKNSVKPLDDVVGASK